MRKYSIRMNAKLLMAGLLATTQVWAQETEISAEKMAVAALPDGLQREPPPPIKRAHRCALFDRVKVFEYRIRQLFKLNLEFLTTDSGLVHQATFCLREDRHTAVKLGVS